MAVSCLGQRRSVRCGCDKLAECKGHRICKYQSIKNVIVSCCKRTEGTVLISS